MVRSRSLPTLFGALVLTSLAACNLGSLVAPQPKPDAMIPFPHYTKTLPNGLEVIVVKTGFPNIVSLQIPVKTGSRNEVEPGKTGFAHFFEHMMFRGTDKFPPEKYQEIITKAGARQNAYTTDDFTNYHITFAKEDLDQILEIEADRFQNLKYPLASFQTEALAVLGEYNKNFANPIRKLFEVQRDAAYTKHTYKHTTMGFIQDIEAMPTQFEYSKQFFDRWYRPQNATVMLVGDVDPDAVFAMVEKHFGSWKRGDFSVDIPVEPKQQKPVYVHHAWPAPTPPMLAVAFHGPAFSETEVDSAAFELLLNLWFGETSEIYDQLVRKDQSIDMLFGMNADNQDPYLVNVLARIKDNKDVVKVRDQLLATCQRAKTELVDAQRLADAKAYLRYSMAATLNSNEAIASTLARYVRFRRSFDTLNNLYRLYSSVTAEQIRDMANKYLLDEALVVTTIANGDLDPAVKTAPKMASLGSSPSASSKSASSATTSIPRSGGSVPPEVRGVKLPDSKILVLESEAPQIVFKLAFQTGSKDDPPAKRGLAELAARMITDAGSGSLTIDEIQKLLYPIAGSFSAQVDREMTVFTGSIHKDNLDRFVDIAVEQLLDPGFRDEDFKRNLDAARNSLLVDLRTNNDEELGRERLLQLIFEGTPYGHPSQGSASGIDSITVDDVKKFIASHYTVGNLTLGISGAVPKDFLARFSARIAGALPVGSKPEAPKPYVAKKSSGLTVDIIQKDTRATAISFGHPIDILRGDPDFVALYLGRTWLGEHRSSLSHLYQQIRELRGMNYGDYAYIEAFPRGGSSFFPATNIPRRNQIFEVWIRPVPPNQAHFALRAALHELEKFVKNGLSEADFEATREYLMKNVFLHTDGQDRELGHALDAQWYGTVEFTKYMRDGLSKLTREQVNATIQKYVSYENLHVVLVTQDAESLRAALLADEFSPMTYNTEKPEEVLAEDKVIGARKLNLKPDQVRIVPVDEVFKN